MLLTLLGGTGGGDPLATAQLVGGRYPMYANAFFCLGGVVQVTVPADRLTPPGACWVGVGGGGWVSVCLCMSVSVTGQSVALQCV